MLGAIIGDIVGSRFEFDRGDKSREFELFTSQCEFTDDTVMTVAVAEALMNAGIDADEQTVKANLIASMKKWGQKYPNAGYGARFIDWVLSDDPKPYGSFGNGSGMRVAPVGWLYDSYSRTREVARWTAEVTHNHPEGVKGAEFTAAAIYLARNGANKRQIKEELQIFNYDLSRTLDDIRPTYKHVEDCMHTIPEAFSCFFEANSYEETLRNVMYIGGDTDTLCAIAGSIAEAYWEIPQDILDKAKEYLSEDVFDVVQRFTNTVIERQSDKSRFIATSSGMRVKPPKRMKDKRWESIGPAVPVDIHNIKFVNIPTGLRPGASESEKAKCKGLIPEDEEYIELPDGGYMLVKKYQNELNYHEMSSVYQDRPAQIPIRGSRLNYLLNDYSPKESDKWIMFNHPNHFVIYNRESKYCIYDVEYMAIDSHEEDNPIVAVVSSMRINQDPRQHSSDDKDDFDKVHDLIVKEL